MITQKGGKKVYAFAAKAGHSFSTEVKSNYFEIEWPPRSGKRLSFPEIDKAAFFTLDEAKKKILEAQNHFWNV